jgi:hypothetical protein
VDATVPAFCVLPRRNLSFAAEEARVVACVASQVDVFEWVERDAAEEVDVAWEVAWGVDDEKGGV